MAFTSLGEYTLGEVVPVALEATAAATLSLNAQLPQLQAKLAALAQLQANVALKPPNILATIQLLTTLIGSLQAAIAVGTPSLTVDATALLAVIAEITTLIGSLSAQLGIVAGIEASLGGASVHLLKFDGTVSELAPGGVPGLSGSADVQALVQVAASSVAWDAMAAVFKTS